MKNSRLEKNKKNRKQNNKRCKKSFWTEKK